MPDHPTVAVLAPSMFVSITIEEGPTDEHEEIHLHAGGQGTWVARMLRLLGERPLVCGPVGGETGRAMHGLVEEWHIEIDAVPIEAPTPAYVHDRRSGHRTEVARTALPQLNRHEIDELYSRMLEHALAAGTCVVTGRFTDDALPLDFYHRLGADLTAADVAVVGDLHGTELDALLELGRPRWLKVSDDDLVEDGVLDDDDRSERSALEAAVKLSDRGASGVVVSRGDRACVAIVEGRAHRVEGPPLEVVDHQGAGDSMTAALTTAVVRALDTESALRLAWGAGAANIVRRGLGSGSRQLIDTLASRAVVTEVEV